MAVKKYSLEQIIAKLREIDLNVHRRLRHAASEMRFENSHPQLIPGRQVSSSENQPAKWEKTV